MSEYYSHSGRVTTAGLFLPLILGGIVALILGAFYSITLNYVPFIKLRFIITLLFGIGTGGAINYLAYFGKMRNNAVLGLVSILCACVFYYSAWGMDVHPRFGFKEIPIGKFYASYQPDFLKEYIAYFYKNGLWSMGIGKKDNAVNGALLATIWTIEAVTIFASIIIGSGAFKKSNKRVFCERCQCWMNYRPSIISRSLTALESKEALISGNPLPIIHAENWDRNTSVFCEIDLFTCPQCTHYQYASLNKVQLTADNKGNINRKVTPVIDKLRIDNQVLEAFQVASQIHSVS
jgi:hypothetical protein